MISQVSWLKSANENESIHDKVSVQNTKIIQNTQDQADQNSFLGSFVQEVYLHEREQKQVESCKIKPKPRCIQGKS